MALFHPLIVLATIFVSKLILEQQLISNMRPIYADENGRNQNTQEIKNYAMSLFDTGDQEMDRDDPYNPTFVERVLRESVFAGTWKSNQVQANFDFLNGQEGTTQQVFGTQGKGGPINASAIWIYDPKYIDQKIVIGILHMNNSYDKNLTFASENQTFYYEKYNYLKKQQKRDIYCWVSFWMQVYNNKNRSAEIKSKYDLSYTLYLNSIDDKCSIDLTMEMSYDTNTGTLAAGIYCLYISVMCIIQGVSVIKLQNYFSSNDSEANKISLLTLGFCTIFDCYFCLANLYLALIITNQLQFFLVPAFGYFILSTIFEMKLLVNLWKSRIQFSTPAEFRKALLHFYLKFYAALFAFMTLMYLFYVYNWFSVWISLFIIPQIVHNAMRGNNPKFYHWYIWGLLFSRLSIPIYFRGCSKNVRMYAPSLEFTVSFCSIVVFQILILFLQYKLKPRFFIPKFLQKGYYDYYVIYEYNPATQSETDDCSICLDCLHLDPLREPEHPVIIQNNGIVPNPLQSQSSSQDQGAQNYSEQQTQKLQLSSSLLRVERGEEESKEDDDNVGNRARDDQKIQNSFIQINGNASQFTQSNMDNASQIDENSRRDLEEMLDEDKKDKKKSDLKEKLIKKPQIFKRKIMKTPCGHRFHCQCLQDWIEIKLECPHCRQPLPPLID